MIKHALILLMLFMVCDHEIYSVQNFQKLVLRVKNRKFNRKIQIKFTRKINPFIEDFLTFSGGIEMEN